MDTTRYCPQCGQPMTVAAEDLGQDVECPRCQCVFHPGVRGAAGPAPPEATSPSDLPPPLPATAGKSRLVAGLLGIFLGGLGVHRFYLGYPGIGVLQILVTMVGCVARVPIGCTPVPVPVGCLWGFIEGILCLAGKMTDADGRPLSD